MFYSALASHFALDLALDLASCHSQLDAAASSQIAVGGRLCLLALTDLVIAANTLEPPGRWLVQAPASHAQNDSLGQVETLVFLSLRWAGRVHRCRGAAGSRRARNRDRRFAPYRSRATAWGWQPSGRLGRA
jgi:hypothetical protein